MPLQRSAERRKQRPVSLRRLRTRKLTLQHPQLMPEQQDLDLLLPLRAKAEHDKLKQPPQHPIQKRQNHASKTTRHPG